MSRRGLVAALGALALAVGLLVPIAPIGPQAATPAAAADARQFDAGDIISDALFFDGGSMSADEVQAFLSGKVRSCLSGYTCLKDYRQTTSTKAAVDYRCNAYNGASNESAATIIARVGAACGISQKVLLVLLEKEQSLVSDNWPTSDQYQKATGYACPDTAACDTQYLGFFNQVYNAALQFKRYAASPTSWNHVAGRVNAIRYSPSAACGSSNVYIQNQATAGLYNYTPYQPNPAALNNLYGTGDGCSAYGNRNFWRIYTDWFGSTTAGSSLVRTLSNPNVYILSGTVKYPVTTQAILDAYAPLGPVGFVSQSYLDSFTTQQVAGRVMRSPGGTIYFTDASIKLPFNSCGLVADYGGQCSTNGFVQLTDDQLSGFATGPAMGPVLGTTAGSRYYITQGTKREILDSASQAAAGLPSGYNVLTENAVATLGLGQPIVRDGVFASQRGSSSFVYLGNGQRYAVDAGAVSAAQVATRSTGSLSGASLAKIAAASSPFAGIVSVTGSPDVSVLADGGRYTWKTGGATLSTVPVPQAFLDTYAPKGQIAAGSNVKTAGSATVYLVMADKLLPVGAWESLVALSANGTPVISIVPDAVVNAMPKGPVALTTNTLVRSDSDATVYLINGVTSKIAMSNFAYATEAGISTFSFTTQDRIDAYARSSTLLGFGLTCGTTNYVSAGGSVHPITDEQKALYPFTFVALDGYTCKLLTVGSPATSFIRTANGMIYQLVGGQKRPITTMARFAELSQGQSFLNVHDLFAAAIPTGPTA
ncbi:hypothetical protein [Leifsonia sp. 21MFCrub1.1]|uniref:hypothetical protein n=1 Tax=Leifsonia sp. 21MFCrub1.1 TaxID=1798223 RepID=UPI0008928348|nr:hypothetical protein [Leifsonia sp. 21MFCrub1.1]SEB00630.1 hypothetical protein SAMN04515680_2592 [Leifsonia sp. 21MFCrub1.1]